MNAEEMVDVNKQTEEAINWLDVEKALTEGGNSRGYREEAVCVLFVLRTCPLISDTHDVMEEYVRLCRLRGQ